MKSVRGEGRERRRIGWEGWFKEVTLNDSGRSQLIWENFGPGRGSYNDKDTMWEWCWHHLRNRKVVDVREREQWWEMPLERWGRDRYTGSPASLCVTAKCLQFAWEQWDAFRTGKTRSNLYVFRKLLWLLCSRIRVGKVDWLEVVTIAQQTVSEDDTSNTYIYWVLTVY